MVLLYHAFRLLSRAFFNFFKVFFLTFWIAIPLSVSLLYHVVVSLSRVFLFFLDFFVGPTPTPSKGLLSAWVGRPYVPS